MLEKNRLDGCDVEVSKAEIGDQRDDRAGWHGKKPQVKNDQVSATRDYT